MTGKEKRKQQCPGETLESGESVDAREPEGGGARRGGISRRAFIGAGAAVVAGLAVGAGAKVAYAADTGVLRPPGSLAEDAFAGACIRCERCISICPEDVLEPMGIEGGVFTIRTPQLTFSKGSCTYCDKCREVCPTGAIVAVDPYKPLEGRIGVAVVDAERCVAFIQEGTCGICVDACEYEALEFDNLRRPVVVEDICNGCGECVCICQANVFTTFSGGSGRGIEVITEADYRAGEKR